MVTVGLRNLLDHPVLLNPHRKRLDAQIISDEHLQVKQQHKELKQWHKNRDIREVSANVTKRPLP
jgi:hypothetical protein